MTTLVEFEHGHAWVADPHEQVEELVTSEEFPELLLAETGEVLVVEAAAVTGLRELRDDKEPPPRRYQEPEAPLVQQP